MNVWEGAEGEKWEEGRKEERKEGWRPGGTGGHLSQERGCGRVFGGSGPYRELKE